MKSYPFDSLQIGTESDGTPIYDREYNSADLRRQIKSCFSNGILANPSDNMQVAANQDMTVIVNPGNGNINGCIFVEDNPRTIEFQASESLDRIDRVVVRFNDTEAVRSIDLYVLKGTAATSPVPPELTTTDTYYELALADVFIPKNSTAISQSRITDQRLNTELCGIMTAVGEVDTTTIFNQYQTALDEYLEIVQQALDQTTAVNLQNQITALENRTTPIANGGTGATTVDGALTNLGIAKIKKYLELRNKVLWTGSWKTGSQTIKDVLKYTKLLFYVTYGTISSVIEFVPHDNKFACGTMAADTTTNTLTLALRGTISATGTVSISHNRLVSHPSNQTHSACVDNSIVITKVVGLEPTNEALE